MANVGLYCKKNSENQTMVEFLNRSQHRHFPIHTEDELQMVIPVNEITVVIMDYETPDGKNAFTVAQRLRDNPETRNVSIVVKINREDDLSREMSAQGINDFLLSPFHEEEFNSLLDKLIKIEKRRPFQSLVRLLLKDGSVLGKTLNISSSGLLVQVTKEINIGSQIGLMFFLPHSKEEIRCDAVIRRRAHERLTFNPCYGIEFTDITEDQKDKLDHFTQRW